MRMVTVFVFISKGNNKARDYLHITGRPNGTLKQVMAKRKELLNKALSESRAIIK